MPEESMREVLILAVVKAADDVDRPQYVRLGKSWITNDTGRKIRVTPRSLPRADLIIYLRKCAYTHANEAVGWFLPGTLDLNFSLPMRSRSSKRPGAPEPATCSSE